MGFREVRAAILVACAATAVGSCLGADMNSRAPASPLASETPTVATPARAPAAPPSPPAPDPRVAACVGHAEDTGCAVDHVLGLCHDRACTPLACGDGRVEGEEECDDGNAVAGDGCSRDCEPEQTTFATPAGTTEVCQRLVPFPLVPADVARGWYRTDDFEAIDGLCELDLYTAVGVCAKLQGGTQPALEIYDLAGTGLGKAAFDRKRCPLLRRQRKARKLAKLKTPVYGREAESALLYFHFSRLLGGWSVPPATYRTLAVGELRRVVAEAIDILGNGSHPMLLSGWSRLQLVVGAKSPKRRERMRKARERLFVVDGALVFGSLARNPHGETGHQAFSHLGEGRIGSAPGFRRTSYYKLVSSRKPITTGLRLDAPRAADRRAALQELAYASDFAQLLLLDHLFHQRDRLGNIHAKAYHHLVDDGGVRWQAKRADDDPPTVPLVRMILKDNDEGLVWDAAPLFDAGVLLAELRHLDPTVYARVQWLAAALRDEAQAALVKAYFVDSVHVSATTYDEVRVRFLDVADGLRRRFDDGKLQLDLDLEAALREEQRRP